MDTVRGLDWGGCAPTRCFMIYVFYSSFWTFEQAQAMHDRGLQVAGYQYVNSDGMLRVCGHDCVSILLALVSQTAGC